MIMNYKKEMVLLLKGLCNKYGYKSQYFNSDNL